METRGFEPLTPCVQTRIGPIRGRSRNAGRARNSASRLRFLFGDIFPLAYTQLRWFPFVYVGYGTRKARGYSRGPGQTRTDCVGGLSLKTLLETGKPVPRSRAFRGELTPIASLEFLTLVSNWAARRRCRNSMTPSEVLTTHSEPPYPGAAQCTLIQSRVQRLWNIR